MKLIYAIPIVAKGKPKRWWLVSRSGGRQLRGQPDESLPAMQEQWEAQIGPIDKMERLADMTVRQAEDKINGLRKTYLERKAKT